MEYDCEICADVIRSETNICPVCGHKMPTAIKGNISIGPSLTKFKLQLRTNDAASLSKISIYWKNVEDSRSFQWKFPGQLHPKILETKDIVSLYVINEAYLDLQEFVAENPNLLSIIEKETISLDEFEKAAKVFAQPI